MQRLSLTIAASALICTTAICTSASAGGPQLKGRYGFSGASHCIQSSVGFTASGEALCGDTGQPISVQPNPAQPRNTCPGVFATTNSVEGVRTFNGNGTGTGQGGSVSLTPPPNIGAISASTDEFTFDFTYTVDGDSFTAQSVPNSFQGQFLTGPRTGQTYTIDQIVVEGLISNDKKSLVVASTEPRVEKQQFSTGDTRYRICHRSRTLIWLGN
jgi:hypothetical protein